MVLVSTETFLAKLAELYAEGEAAEGQSKGRGAVAVSCKSGACEWAQWRGALALD